MPDSVSMTGSLYGELTGRYQAQVETAQAGVIAGLELLQPETCPGPVGDWNVVASDGDSLASGATLIELSGAAAELSLAEDYVLGTLGFASGVATRAAEFRAATPAGLQLACGGWKKLPAALKPVLRAGLQAGGILPRLVAGDFVYLGKNGVRLLGGVEEAVARALEMNHGPVSIQVASVAEARQAVAVKAGIIMVDTGCVEDLAAVHNALTADGLRDGITLAFGGGVRMEQLQAIRQAGADTADVGRAIIDAPILDLRVRVL